MRLIKPLGLALGLFVSATIVGACSADRPLAPKALRLHAASASDVLPDIRISEFHYDNNSNDVGEAIEISGPAGASLAGWSVVRYNGSPSQRNVYTTPAALNGLPATIPAT